MYFKQLSKLEKREDFLSAVDSIDFFDGADLINSKSDFENQKLDYEISLFLKTAKRQDLQELFEIPSEIIFPVMRRHRLQDFTNEKPLQETLQPNSTFSKLIVSFFDFEPLIHTNSALLLCKYYEILGGIILLTQYYRFNEVVFILPEELTFIEKSFFSIREFAHLVKIRIMVAKKPFRWAKPYMVLDSLKSYYKKRKVNIETKNFLFLDALSIYFLYKATIDDIPPSLLPITVNGKRATKKGVYFIPVGTKIEKIENFFCREELDDDKASSKKRIKRKDYLPSITILGEPLIDQLKEGGRLVIPVGDMYQDLKVIVKEKSQIREE